MTLPKPPDASARDIDDDGFSLAKFAAVFRNRQLLPWYLIIVANMFLVGILFGFLPVYIYSLDYDQLQSGLIVGACTLAYLLIQPVAGRLPWTARERHRENSRGRAMRW